MDGVGRRRDAQERARSVEGHARDGAGVCAPSELKQLLAPWYAEHPYYRTRLTCRGQESAIVVQGDTRQRRLVCLDYVDRLERKSIVYEDVA
jgi:hypothetical protein